MKNYVDLIKPFQRRVIEIKESLYSQQLLSAGDEKMIYGTFEKEFKNFSIQSFRNGNRVKEIDFFNASISELEQIEDDVKKLEKKIHSEVQNNIQYPSILSIIHDTKQKAKERIKFFEEPDTKKSTVPKPRNIKSKITYKWLIDESKLYDFKRLLIKNELISNDIDFQDFKSVFSEKSIAQIKNRIVWKSDNATQLIYLINELLNRGILKKKKKNFDYKLLYQCFEKSNRELFTEKGKSLKNNIDIKISTDFKTVTGSIISELLK